MTKLMVVLAVVVVVILVVVFVAVRNMRAEDPEEFADRPRGRAGDRASRDDRDLRYDRREPAGRPPARAGRGGRPAGRPAGNGYRPATGPDERRTAPPRGGQERRRSGQDRTAESLAPARARPARGRPPGDSSEWDSSEWEKLSDIDYWTELASNKPLTTTAQPAEARPAADQDAETAALHGPVPQETAPRRAPRRDPATGFPVRDLPQPADAGLADAGFADAGLADGGPADAGLADTVLADIGLADIGLADMGPADTGLADMGLAGATGPAAYAAAPVLGSPAQDQMLRPSGRAAYAAATPPAAAAQDQMRPLAEPYAAVPRHAGTPGFPGPDRGAPPSRPPADPDDDPLTSPSFPKVPASDSRSYHNGRGDTPAGGSHAAGRHLAPAQQFTSYGPAAPQRAAARHASGQHALPADVFADTGRTNPNGYLPDPLLDGNPYPMSAASAPPVPVPPVPMPPDPAPAAAAPPAPIASASGNPYGSYVTPGSHAAASYDDYPGMPGNGHGSYLPAAVPADTGHAGNGYWQPTAPGYSPGASAYGYQGGPAPDPGARDAGAPAAEHRNGRGRHHQPAYLPGGYAAGPQDQAGYARPDPYGHNGYSGYPEYGTGGH